MSVPAEIQAVVRDIHASPTRAVVCVTGGAASAISWLLMVPGASKTVIEALVPYSRTSLAELLGREPASFASAETAVEMAVAAYRRAASLTVPGGPFVGVAAACALVSDTPKKGDHRCHVALHSHRGSRVYSLALQKGSRTRVQEDDLASRLLILGFAEACGVLDGDVKTQMLTHLARDPGLASTESMPNLGQIDPDRFESGWRSTGDPLDGLLQKRYRCVEFSGPEVVVDAPRQRLVVLPGSFNPLHTGHQKLLEVAQQLTGLPGCFEIAVQNADKGFLSKPEVEKRVSQFVALGLPVMLTSIPIFTDKAEVFRKCKFVVGYDTAARLVMRKYYENSKEKMLVEFEKLRQLGCSFLVVGRKADDGTFKVLADVDVPQELDDLFCGVPETGFREDISSTEIRNRQRT